jgi:hypothetical protein
MTYKDREHRREANRRYEVRHPERGLLRNAKTRAKEFGLSFSLTPSDIVIPSNCPVDGLPIVRSNGHGGTGFRPRSPSLDQKQPRGGYTKDNVQVISMLWNRRKGDMTVEDVKTLLRFMEPQSSFPVESILSFGA